MDEATIDRALRVIAGAGILSLALIGPKTPWASGGSVPLATGIIGICPLDTVFGVPTCRSRK